MLENKSPWKMHRQYQRESHYTEKNAPRDSGAKPKLLEE